MANLTDNNVAQSAHRVKVAMGYTVNMKDFESLRLDFGLEIDGIGNPNVTFEKAYAWTEKKLLDKVTEVKEQLT